MVQALLKVKASGEKYQRRLSVQKILSGLVNLSPESIAKKCESERDTIPSEVLVHLLRNSDIELNPMQFKVVFDILTLRVESILRSKVDDQHYDRAEILQEEILGKIVELIAVERNEPGTKLDYYEVNFNHAFKCLRISYLRKSGAAKTRSVALTVEYEGTVDILPEVEERMSEIMDLQNSNWEDSPFRYAMLAAIDKLPADQKHVIGLLLQGMPVEFIDENVMTISRALDCTDRTVRNRKSRAFKVLLETILAEELL